MEKRTEELFQKLAANNCAFPIASLKYVDCAVNSPFQASFNPTSQTISICSHLPVSLQQQALRHELVHYYDTCLNTLPAKPSCDQILRSEVRAAVISGDCDLKEELMKGNFSFNWLTDCAKRRSVLATRLVRGCKSVELSKEIFEESLKSCE